MKVLRGSGRGKKRSLPYARTEKKGSDTSTEVSHLLRDGKGGRKERVIAAGMTFTKEKEKMAFFVHGDDQGPDLSSG